MRWVDEPAAMARASRERLVIENQDPEAGTTQVQSSDVGALPYVSALAGFGCFEAFRIRGFRHGDAVDDASATLDRTDDPFGF